MTKERGFVQALMQLSTLAQKVIETSLKKIQTPSFDKFFFFFPLCSSLLFPFIHSTSTPIDHVLYMGTTAGGTASHQERRSDSPITYTPCTQAPVDSSLDIPATNVCL
jgi:hypothetical protein